MPTEKKSSFLTMYVLWWVRHFFSLFFSIKKKKHKITVFEDGEKFKPLCTLARIIKCSNHYGKHVADAQKIETRTTIWPSHPNSRYIPSGKQRLDEIFANSVHSSTISNSEEVEAAQMLIFRWMGKWTMVETTMECYLPFKGNSCRMEQHGWNLRTVCQWNKPFAHKKCFRIPHTCGM